VAGDFLIFNFGFLVALLRSEPRRLGQSYEGLVPYCLQSRQAGAELGPLEPAYTYPGHSLRDGVTFRFRGGIRRAPAAGGELGPWRKAEEAKRVATDEF
jgi:hypothetical protein